jgi:PDZ domain-containing secreted protein
MLEDGYDLMGHSNFTGPYTSPNLALQHAKSIKADMVLLYDRQINDSSRATIIKKAREKARKANRVKETGNLTEIEINDDDLVDENVKYEINATYWVKLPKPTFGAHFIKLNSDIEAINGVQIIAVIKGSPAAIAGILRNDSITSIAEQSVNNPEDLIGAIRKNKGKLIEVGYIRGGKQSKVNVKL